LSFLQPAAISSEIRKNVVELLGTVSFEMSVAANVKPKWKSVHFVSSLIQNEMVETLSQTLHNSYLLSSRMVASRSSPTWLVK